MTFTPKYRYVRVRTDGYSDSNTSDPILFAIDNEVMLFSGDMEDALNAYIDSENIAQFIFESALKIARSQGQELYEKTINLKSLNYNIEDYLQFSEETNEFKDADQILNFADLDYYPYKSAITGMTADEGIGYDGIYELPEEDERELIQSRKPEIPALAIQDQIEYLRSLDEVINLSVWTESDLEEAIAAEGYTGHYANVLAVADEIRGLLGKNDAHKNFILNIAVNRAIKDGAIKD